MTSLFEAGKPYLICDIDGCIIDDSHRLHLIDSANHDFEAYHDAMIHDTEALTIGRLFIEEAVSRRIPIAFFTLRPVTHRAMTNAALSRIFQLRVNQDYVLYMRNPGEEKVPAVKIKSEMLSDFISLNGLQTTDCITAIDDHYGVVEMYQRSGLPAFVVNKGQLIDGSCDAFRALSSDGTCLAYPYLSSKNVDIIFSNYENKNKNETHYEFMRVVIQSITEIFPQEPSHPLSKKISVPDNIGAAHEKSIAAEVEATQDGIRDVKTKETPDAPEIGRKFDNEKLRFSLLPIESIEEVLKVLEFGANKYDVDNWKFVDNAQERYYDAALRHQILGSASGEDEDPETGYKHTAHAICCLLFKLWFELKEDKLNQEKEVINGNSNG